MKTSILQQLRDVNVIVSDIVKDCGVTRSTVYQSIDGAGSRKVRLHIAKKLNTLPSILWDQNAIGVIVIDDALFRTQQEHIVFSISDPSLFGG